MPQSWVERTGLFVSSVLISTLMNWSMNHLMGASSTLETTLEEIRDELHERTQVDRVLLSQFDTKGSIAKK